MVLSSPRWRKMTAANKPKRAVTSIDVAIRAGVSQSAVSRTFSNGAPVSEETRRKVMRAARELSYRPNAIARSLSTRQSNIIGVVISHFDNPHYPVVLEALSRALQTKGKHTMLFWVDQSNSDRVLNELLSHQLDGIVIDSTSQSAKLAKQCTEMGIPVVMFNRAPDGDLTDSVTCDNRQAGQIAGEKLIASGHRRIAFISGRSQSATSADREEGLRNAIRQAGISLFAQANGDSDRAAASAATLSLMRESVRPDAIVVASDFMAFAVIDTLRHELNLSVPDDVSVISFDNVPQAAWSSYGLTSVAQSINKLVSATVELLTHPAPPEASVSRNVVVACELVERSSVAMRRVA
jgi:DNA-binding LacI/PurR family transcriptional regulator